MFVFTKTTFFKFLFCLTMFYLEMMVEFSVDMTGECLIIVVMYSRLEHLKSFLMVIINSHCSNCNTNVNNLEIEIRNTLHIIVRRFPNCNTIISPLDGDRGLLAEL